MKIKIVRVVEDFLEVDEKFKKLTSDEYEIHDTLRNELLKDIYDKTGWSIFANESGTICGIFIEDENVLYED